MRFATLRTRCLYIGSHVLECGTPIVVLVSVVMLDCRYCDLDPKTKTLTYVDVGSYCHLLNQDTLIKFRRLRPEHTSNTNHGRVLKLRCHGSLEFGRLMPQ